MIVSPPKDWPRELARFIEERQTKRFDWASNNCAFFACDWIALRTGVDPAASFRDHVTGPLSAVKAMRRGGGLLGIATDACRRWGWSVVDRRMARRGDVAYLPSDGFGALGVCVGTKAAFLSTAGLAFIPTEKCCPIWRID